nr:uncharacterized protein LOC114925075 [Arachis hypogaea]
MLSFEFLGFFGFEFLIIVRTELKNSLSNPKIFLTLKFPFKPLLRRHFIFTLEPSSFLRRPSSSSSLEPSLIFIFWNPTLHRTQKTLTSITPPSISLVRRCVSQLATPFAVLLAVLVVVLLATLCRGSARLSLSRFCSPLPVVKYCSENNKRLIHFSTCEVYGKTIGSFLPKDSYASVDWRLWLSLWPDKKAYNETLLKLAGLFQRNLETFINHKIGKDNKLTGDFGSWTSVLKMENACCVKVGVAGIQDYYY